MPGRCSAGFVGGSAVPGWQLRQVGEPASRLPGEGCVLAVLRIGDPRGLSVLTDPLTFVLAYVTAKQQ